MVLEVRVHRQHSEDRVEHGQDVNVWTIHRHTGFLESLATLMSADMRNRAAYGSVDRGRVVMVDLPSRQRLMSASFALSRLTVCPGFLLRCLARVVSSTRRSSVPSDWYTAIRTAALRASPTLDVSSSANCSTAVRTRAVMQACARQSFQYTPGSPRTDGRAPQPMGDRETTPASGGKGRRRRR